MFRKFTTRGAALLATAPAGLEESAPDRKQAGLEESAPDRKQARLKARSLDSPLVDLAIAVAFVSLAALLAGLLVRAGSEPAGCEGSCAVMLSQAEARQDDLKWEREAYRFDDIYGRTRFPTAYSFDFVYPRTAE